MVRGIGIFVCIFIFLLAACTPPGLDASDPAKKIVQKTSQGESKQEKKVEITPIIKSSDQYRTVVDFTPGAARGHILYGVDNRLDIDELETGLMRLSKPSFPTDKYVFQEGQYLDHETLESWLENQYPYHKTKEEKKHYNPDGLNPKLPKNYYSLSAEKKITYLKEHPSYLSYVAEQNYLLESGKNKLKLGGVSIAISMAKVYSYRIEDQGKLYRGDVNLDPEVAKKKAKQMAAKILERMRDLQDGALRKIPIVIALYQEQTADSLVPGYYFAKAVVKPGDHVIGDWKAIHESHVLFPSSEASEEHKEEADRISKFTSKIQEYFPNFTGVVGKGFYKDKQLQQLTLRIPIQFYEKTEVISFTQFVTGIVGSGFFPKGIPVSVSISSSAGPEALIVLKPDMDQPFVHIYHHEK